MTAPAACLLSQPAAGAESQAEARIESESGSQGRPQILEEKGLRMTLGPSQVWL